MTGRPPQTCAQEVRGLSPNLNGVSPADRLLTAEDVAARWQVAKAQVYRQAREGRLPSVKIGRYYRFRLSAIEDFEAEGGTADG